MLGSKSVSIGLATGQDASPIPIVSHTTEQTNRRQEQGNQHGLERASFAVIEKYMNHIIRDTI
jgi:hypothetical protein